MSLVSDIPAGDGKIAILVLQCTGMLCMCCARCSVITGLKVHKNENFFGFDFEFCTISL